MRPVWARYTGAPESVHTARYTAVNTATGTPLGKAEVSLRCVAAYSPIIGSALGSIIAVIITPQPSTKASPSDTVSGMNMVIIMSGAPRLVRMTSTQAAAANRSKASDVTIVARFHAGVSGPPDGDLRSVAGPMGAVYAPPGSRATRAGALSGSTQD